MGKGYSQYLQGDCLNTPLNNTMEFFKAVNLNLAFSSPNCSNQRVSGFFGCGSSPLLTPPKPYTYQIPPNYIPPSDTIVYGRMYGKSSDTDVKTLTFLDGSDVWFNSTEVAPWAPTAYCPFPYNVYNRSGPAFSQSSCYGSMVRKLANNNTYIDRLMYDWVDASLEVPWVDYNYKLCQEPCKTKNWLIMSQPATSLYTSIPEPFLITSHYEQSGSAVPSSSLYGGNLYIPFCDPMPVRSADGTPRGYYTGLSFLPIFGQASIVFPTQPYLPPDQWSPVPPPNTPKVNPRNAFFSIELWTFFRGTSLDPNFIVGSPLISKVRFYLYSLAPGGPGQSRDWRFPFRILFQDTVYADYATPIDCNIIGSGTPLRITLNQTNIKCLVTY